MDLAKVSQTYYRIHELVFSIYKTDLLDDFLAGNGMFSLEEIGEGADRFHEAWSKLTYANCSKPHAQIMENICRKGEREDSKCSISDNWIERRKSDYKIVRRENKHSSLEQKHACKFNVLQLWWGWTFFRVVVCNVSMQKLMLWLWEVMTQTGQTSQKWKIMDKRLSHSLTQVEEDAIVHASLVGDQEYTDKSVWVKFVHGNSDTLCVAQVKISSPEMWKPRC